MPSSAVQMAACCPFLGELPYAVVLTLVYYTWGGEGDDGQGSRALQSRLQMTSTTNRQLVILYLLVTFYPLPNTRPHEGSKTKSKRQATPHRYPLPLR